MTTTIYDQASAGNIITFYSFKGGVGRTMALINIAVLLARANKSVLIIDWDLEAPGLTKYLSQSQIRHAREFWDCPGTVDEILLSKRERPFDWSACINTIFFPGGQIDYISSGKEDPNYVKRLQSIDWIRLLSEHRIGDAFEHARDQMKSAYDYILIDSRTGVTDIGDVCTGIFADILVLMYVSNSHNVDGVCWMYERAQRVSQALPVGRS